MRKRNRFEIAPQALLVSAGVILSIILISIMVSQFEKAKSLSAAVSEKLVQDTAAIADSDIMQYDGITVTGADVRNFYRRYFTQSGSELGELTVDNGVTVTVYRETGHYSEMTDPEDECFIPPADLFEAEVAVNKNGVITDVRFTRRKE